MEGIIVARRAGVPDDVLLDVLNHGTAANYFSQVRYPQYVRTRTFDAGMRVGLVAKDLQIALDAAVRGRVRPPPLRRRAGDVGGRPRRPRPGRRHHENDGRRGSGDHRRRHRRPPRGTLMTRLGFIGLGIMGTPMAGHLAAAGYPLSVHDIDPGAADRFAKTHPAAAVADDAASVGQHVDVVITMLPDGEQVQQVALDAGRAHRVDGRRFAAARLLVGPTVADAGRRPRALAANGIAMVDAPVSGAQWGAEAAELVFMVGGADDDVERVRPLLDLLGRATFHVGPIGCGHVMKSINNTITAMTFLATAEGLVLGTRAGLDPAAMNAVLNESTGGSWITRNHIEPRILTRTFDDPFRLELMLKDVAIATQLSRDLGLPLPFVALAREPLSCCRSRRRAGTQPERARTVGGTPDRSRDRIRWRGDVGSYTILVSGRRRDHDE